MDKKRKKIEQILEASLILFSKKGFYSTTIPDIADAMSMSVGNLYNYFSSKEELAMEVIKYSSEILGGEIRQINELKITSKEKIKKIVELYFDMAIHQPQHIDFFLRVYLANKEVFKNGCEGMICVASFVTELMIFFEEGVRNKELRNQNFFSAFGLFMGYLGGFVFLNGEGILDDKLENYTDEIAENIFNALRIQN
ncbi:TetR/AcrR family transcriptional regulator [Sulfurospirillum sp. 1612]|uniref:TetR/AcrR family transcriptional regulator n=1 Tax=Sulfurospirillum sp. 1612 TaxID=3094835 RepID=UPI002F9544CC